MKAYIIPQTIVVKIDAQSGLMQMSVSTNEINGNNAGLVKEDNSSSGSSYNVWDDDWSR